MYQEISNSPPIKDNLTLILLPNIVQMILLKTLERKTKKLQELN